LKPKKGAKKMQHPDIYIFFNINVSLCFGALRFRHTALADKNAQGRYFTLKISFGLWHQNLYGYLKVRNLS
jgi:hypothetical protein